MAKRAAKDSRLKGDALPQGGRRQDLKAPGPNGADRNQEIKRLKKRRARKADPARKEARSAGTTRRISARPRQRLFTPEQQIRHARRLLTALATGRYQEPCPGLMQDLALAIIRQSEADLARQGKPIAGGAWLDQKTPAALPPLSRPAATGETDLHSAPPSRPACPPPAEAFAAGQNSWQVRIEPDRMYSTRETARLLAVSTKTLEAWRGSGNGELPFRRIGKRSVRYLGADILACIEAGRRANTSQT